MYSFCVFYLFKLWFRKLYLTKLQNRMNFGT